MQCMYKVLIGHSLYIGMAALEWKGRYADSVVVTGGAV